MVTITWDAKAGQNTQHEPEQDSDRTVALNIIGWNGLRDLTANRTILIDHVHEVRLHLWTPATNEPVVHSPGDVWAWRTMMEWYRQGKLQIRPPQLSGNPNSSHLAANQRELGEGNYEFSIEVTFSCHKILQHGADGFTCPPKEGVQRIFSPLKIHRFGRISTREPWV
jgi:hypothetical protein